MFVGIEALGADDNFRTLCLIYSTRHGACAVYFRLIVICLCAWPAGERALLAVPRSNSRRTYIVRAVAKKLNNISAICTHAEIIAENLNLTSGIFMAV